jgi:hypothetical protein
MNQLVRHHGDMPRQCEELWKSGEYSGTLHMYAGMGPTASVRERCPLLDRSRKASRYVAKKAQNALSKHASNCIY